MLEEREKDSFRQLVTEEYLLAGEGWRSRLLILMLKRTN